MSGMVDGVSRIWTLEYRHGALALMGYKDHQAAALGLLRRDVALYQTDKTLEELDRFAAALAELRAEKIQEEIDDAMPRPPDEEMENDPRVDTL